MAVQLRILCSRGEVPVHCRAHPRGRRVVPALCPGPCHDQAGRVRVVQRPVHCPIVRRQDPGALLRAGEGGQHAYALWRGELQVVADATPAVGRGPHQRLQALRIAPSREVAQHPPIDVAPIRAEAEWVAEPARADLGSGAARPPHPVGLARAVVGIVRDLVAALGMTLAQRRQRPVERRRVRRFVGRAALRSRRVRDLAGVGRGGVVKRAVGRAQACLAPDLPRHRLVVLDACDPRAGHHRLELAPD